MDPTIPSPSTLSEPEPNSEPNLERGPEPDLESNPDFGERLTEPQGYQTIVHRLASQSDGQPDDLSWTPYVPPAVVPAVVPPLVEEPLTARRQFVHTILFVLTILTTTGVGALWFYREGDSFAMTLGSGMLYSFSLVTILTAHEMGHYIACRWYGVSATLPYFIPVPLPPVGSFGAFIRIKSPIPNRRALFDIGIAGPLAGFVFILPAALIAHYFAAPAAPVEATEGLVYFESPLLFKFFEWLFSLPEMVELNPVMWAAWVGTLMTSLNLLPVGQLDGGHVTYAVFGARGNRIVGLLSYLAVIGLALVSLRNGNWNWVVWVLILTFMLRAGHPPVLDAEEPIGLPRTLIALIGLIVFILCFMPIPIRM